MRESRLIFAIGFLAIAIPVFAQYGHPLKGSWSGDWWLVKGKENRILLDFNFSSAGYGNTTLTGVLNPGPDQAPMQNLTLTPPDVFGAGKAAMAAREAAIKRAMESAPGKQGTAPLMGPAGARGGSRGPATAAATVPAAESSSILTIGSTGESVAALQKRLTELGYLSGETNGRFGKLTQDAVLAFQKGRSLPPDGIAGPQTIAALGVGMSAQAASGGAGSRAVTTPARGGAPAIRDNVAIALDPWILHFEADSKDASGKPVRYIVDGQMENLGAAYSRVITGTWKVGTQVGSFKVIRN